MIDKRPMHIREQEAFDNYVPPPFGPFNVRDVKYIPLPNRYGDPYIPPDDAPRPFEKYRARKENGPR